MRVWCSERLERTRPGHAMSISSWDGNRRQGLESCCVRSVTTTASNVSDACIERR